MQVSLLKKRVNIGSGTPSRWVNLITSFDLDFIDFLDLYNLHILLVLAPDCPLAYVCRIKKLIDIEALGLSRLDMIVLDMHTDVKGFSLFTLPQVRFGFSTLEQAVPSSSTNEWIFLIIVLFDICRDEFWDLYKNCFHQRVLEGRLRICMYGPKPAPNLKKKKKEWLCLLIVSNSS